MVRIVKQSTILEVPETIEEGSAKIICSKPYQIERVEYSDEVIWFGFNTNWKLDKTNNQWYVLVIGSDFVPCDVPEYEKIYEELMLQTQNQNTIQTIITNKILSFARWCRVWENRHPNRIEPMELMYEMYRTEEKNK